MLRNPWSLPSALALSGLLCACSPTLNWRDVTLDPQTRAQFPCKPERAERTLPLGGAPTRAAMWACEAGGLSWSATVLDVGDPARLGAVLREARLGLSGRLQAGEAAVRPVQIAGMTPNPEARRVVLHGPAGVVRAEAVFAARGLQVYQLVVLAPREAPTGWAEGADEFLRSLRWP